jgi:hypothetical protein
MGLLRIASNSWNLHSWYGHDYHRRHRLEHSDYESGRYDSRQTAIGGNIVLVFLWLALLQYGIWLLKKSYRYRSQQVYNQELTIWTLIGLVFIGIKLIYATVYLFDRKDSAISPIYGKLAVKVVLVVGVQLLAVIALTIGGYRSLNIAQIPLPDISGPIGCANLSGGQLARPKQTKRGLHHARVTVVERV